MKTYKYSLLNFQPSLREQERSEPFAVVVESPTSVFIIGRDPSDQAGISDVGKAMVKALPERVVQYVTEALREDQDDILSALADRFSWNVFVSPAEEHRAQSEEIDEVAFHLYVLHVRRGRPQPSPPWRSSK